MSVAGHRAPTPGIYTPSSTPYTPTGTPTTSIPTSPTSMPSLLLDDDIDAEANTKKHGLILTHFPFSLVLDITTSEPRDVLQSERTTLVFVRFATSLFFTALGIMYNFKLKTADDETSTTSKYTENQRSIFSTVVSYLLIVLALATLIISWINYFVTVRQYAEHKIYTYNFNNFSTVVIVTAVIITLIGICVALIVESMLQES